MTGSLKLNTPSAGSVTLSPADTASNVTVTIPAATATLVDASSTQTLTNKTMTAAGGNTVEATSGPTSTQLAGMRNKIINGAMMIDQRNAGASVTINSTANVFIADRWFTNGQSLDGVYTVQQSSDAPGGFTTSLKFTVTTADSSIGATQDYTFRQRIEGYNFSDLCFGTANAKAISLSFWVKSSVTGTFGGSLFNGNGDRIYVFSYTVASANTWEQKNISIAGDISGAWNTTNGTAVNVTFSLGVGSSYKGTAGSWGSSFYFAPTSSIDLISTNGATFYITGVQLEKGATATPFENRLYGTELALCQRYYWTINGVQDGLATAVGSGLVRSNGNTQIAYCKYPVTMRSSPTFSFASLIAETGNLQNAAVPSGVYSGLSSARLDFNISGQTSGSGFLIWLATASSASYVNASAEL